jgi:hypothetical protein
MEKNTWDYAVFRWDTSRTFCWVISKIRFDEFGLGFSFELWLKRIEIRVFFWSIDIGWGNDNDLPKYFTEELK